MSFQGGGCDIRHGTLHDDLWIKPVPSYYSTSQVVQWLSCIQYETTFTEQELASGLFPVNLYNLSVLMRLHLVAFPFENTAMHYTADHYMDVSPEGAFRRLVNERQGSYCFGQNTVFLGMLRGLGYRAYSGVARVNTSPPDSDGVDYTPLTHMVIFVQPIIDSNVTFLTDVGFGGPNLAQPILLSNAESNVVLGAAPPAAHRLTRGSHPSSSLETTQSSNISPSVDWHLEVTRDIENPTWSIRYAFSEAEFFLPDHASASFSVSMAPGQTMFWHDVVIVKYFLMSEEESEIIEKTGIMKRLVGAVGTDTKIDRPKATWLGQKIMAKCTVKRQVGSKSEIIKELKDEVERIRAAREIFEINIDDSAAKYIEGRPPAISKHTGGLTPGARPTTIL